MITFFQKNAYGIILLHPVEKYKQIKKENSDLGKAYLLLIHYFSEVYKCVPHPAERSVYADIRNIGYLLEAQPGIVTQNNNLPLVVWKLGDHFPYILLNLFLNHVVFDILIGEFP